VRAFSSDSAGTRALFILTGLFAIAFGAVFVSRPDIGAVTLALLFGLFSLIYGISRITLGVQLHQLHQQGRSARPSSALPTAA